MTEYKNVLTEKKDNVLIVKIQREKALNALNDETVAELQQVFDAFSADADIRCAILTGAGPKAFVAGADITELSKLDVASAVETAARGLKLAATIQNSPKPVIAAINGFALGGGCEIAMACDIRVASEKARLGQPEINLGIIPGYGGTQRLSRLVGRGKAMQLILSGDMINAAEAHRVGLVDEIYPPEELMDKAMEMAAALAGKPPVAVAATKKAINDGLNMTLDDGCNLEKDVFSKLFATDDQTEGMAAFIERRKANFTGK